MSPEMRWAPSIRIAPLLEIGEVLPLNGLGRDPAGDARRCDPPRHEVVVDDVGERVGSRQQGLDGSVRQLRERLVARREYGVGTLVLQHVAQARPVDRGEERVEAARGSRRLEDVYRAPGWRRLAVGRSAGLRVAAVEDRGVHEQSHGRGDDQRDQHAHDEEAGSAHRSLRGSTTAPSDRIEGTHSPTKMPS